MTTSPTRPTTIQFNGHSSIIINNGFHILLCDPWYGTAFSSWDAWPPPAITSDVLIGLGRAGKLSVVISHAHDDHMDLEFLRKMPKVHILIPDDEILRAELNEFKNVDVLAWGSIIGYFLTHYSANHSGVISIETPDAMIYHGNDVYDLPEETIKKILRDKPANKPSIYMGQGGSASCWPLRYRYTPERKSELLKQKVETTVKSLHALSSSIGCDRTLAYACFSRARCGDEQWLPHKSTASYANKLCKTDKFTNLNPGDVYIPATDQTINLLPTFSSDKYDGVPQWQPKATWEFRHHSLIGAFMDGLTAEAEKHTIQFTLNVIDRGAWIIGDATRPRKKSCWVQADIMAAVLDGEIPFNHLQVGYLAEWERTPDIYNAEFVAALEAWGWVWMDRVRKSSQGSQI